MSLRELLSAPATLDYNHTGDSQQPAQKALLNSRKELLEYVPIGYRVKKSGVAVKLPVIPWISILNPELTTTTQAGLYVVYLYSADMKKLFLSMNQGYTRHAEVAEVSGFKGKAKRERACETLRTEAHDLLAGLQIRDLVPTRNVATISLGANGDLPKGYEAGHIVGFEYSLSQMPIEEVLQDDLDAMFTIYDATRAINDEIRTLGQKERITVSTDPKTANMKSTKSDIAAGFFEPRTTSEYVAHFTKMTYQVSPLHEALLTEFAKYAESKSWEPKNKKIGARDLVLVNSSGVEILVEAKTVGQSQESVVRQAIGQLFSYRYVYYDGKDIPLVALFNRPIAELWQGLLTSINIDFIYSHESKWEGTGLRHLERSAK
jgi:hypothetical protein